MRKKPIYLISLLAAVILAAAVVFLVHHRGKPGDDPKGHPGTLTAVSLRLPIPIIEAGSAPFFVAADQGYYAEEGLAVSFEMGSKELNPVKTVASGTDTFGLLGGPDTLLVARSKGVPIKALLIVHRNSNFPVVLSLASSNVTQVQDLKDQKVGFYYGHITTDVLRNFFRKTGVHVNEVDVGFDYSPLIAGQVKAEWGFRTTAGLDLPAKGIAINMINPADVAGIVTHGYTVFATEETISSKPVIVEKFVRATLRGIRFTIDHPEEANKSLLNRDPHLDVALSLKRLRLYNEVTSATADYPPGYMDTAMFQTTYDRLKEEKVIGKEFPVSEAFTTKFIGDIHAAMGKHLTEPQK